MTKRELLEHLSFGKSVAEHEAADLTSYFVETDHWRRIFSGDIDLVYGPKGSGKSAIYTLLLNREPDLFDRGILIVPAENPRGATAFDELVADPPTNEAEFRNLWKLYLLQLVAQSLRDYSISPALSKKVIEPLTEAGLLPPKGLLGRYLRAAIDYVRRHLNPDSVEGEMKVDPGTGVPTGFSGKITFREPTEAQRLSGAVSTEKLFEIANDALRNANVKIWLAIDRLDVAFAESQQLERNALRALFRVYLDLKAFEQIALKIFLRSDIWQRILKDGFREASHIRDYVEIYWDEPSLLNLVVRRLLHNQAIERTYAINISEILADSNKQGEFFYRVFPEQVDAGSRKPETLDWILDRTCDGTGYTAPRELIHLLTSARNAQLRHLELGQPEPTGEILLDRTALKAALPEVSKLRFEQTLCAEYPDLTEMMRKLEGEKTLQTSETLAKVWGSSKEEALAMANRLTEIGFFQSRGEKNEPQFWVPFLYRSALDMVQGTAGKDE